MRKMMTSDASYILIYTLLAIPTYILPYLGSNSYIVQGLSSALFGGILKPLFLLHLVIMLLMIAITWFRAEVIHKKYLVLFPVIALIFDLLPIVNNIPMIPTIMHVLAILCGVSIRKVIEI